MRDIGWGRSSFCIGGDCVEVGWYKSSFSDTANSCVYVKAKHGVVYVRDSKQTREDGQHFGPVQVWELDEWRGLIGTIKVGWRPDGVSAMVDGCVEFGLDRHDKHVFTQKEWKAFVEGVIAEEFEPAALTDRWKLSSPAEVPPGGVPAAGRNGLDTGQASSASEVRHGHDPASNATESRVLPEVQADIAATGADTDRPDTAPVAAQPETYTLAAYRQAQAMHRQHGDASLDDELDLLISSAPAVAEERPVTGDRSEAGTGTSPGPVPAAGWDFSDEADLLEAAWGLICNADTRTLNERDDEWGAAARRWREGYHSWLSAYLQQNHTSPVEDANEWAKAIAPLVPTDGAS